MQHFYKIFYSKINKLNWLNEMGKKGYRLVNISGYKYTFAESSQNNETYSYSLEYLEYSPYSDKAEIYFSEYKERDIEPVIISGNWVYFISRNRTIDVSPKVYKNNSKVYLWRAIYLYFFAIWTALVCGYQFFAVDYLMRIGHESDGLMHHLDLGSSGTGFDKVLTLLEKPINFIIDWFNEFYLIWIAEKFGSSDAYIVLAFFLPLLFILLIFACYNTDEFCRYRILAKKKLTNRS